MLDYSAKTSHDGDPDKYSLWHEGVLRECSFDNKDTLDIGSGTGGFLLHIRDSSRSVMGIDPNKQNCDIAMGRSLNVVCDYPENVQGIDGKFDVVTCFEVIEHLYDPHKVIETVERALRSGGVAFVTTPNAFNIIRRVRFVLSGEHHDSLMDPTRSDEPEHIRGYSFAMMIRLVNKSKTLKMSQVYGVSRIFDHVFVFKNKFLVKLLAQHLIVKIKKS
jgi:2-polyprenyl-3-methyl-5-hydroxy-6-metoxy-1,4-benzoquinol methylase